LFTKGVKDRFCHFIGFSSTIFPTVNGYIADIQGVGKIFLTHAQGFAEMFYSTGKPHYFVAFFIIRSIASVITVIKRVDGTLPRIFQAMLQQLDKSPYTTVAQNCSIFGFFPGYRRFSCVNFA
jgi:hypothetical protein